MRAAGPCSCATSPQVADGDAEPTSYVRFQLADGGAQPAVTIAVAKRKGTNAIDVGAPRRPRSSTTLRGTLIPADVHVTVTRDYGETAAEKSNELLWHMLLAVLSVSLLIWLVARPARGASSCSSRFR